MLQSTSRWKKLQLDTDSVEDFARATRELKFESYNGGRDSKERLAQGTIKLNKFEFRDVCRSRTSAAIFWLIIPGPAGGSAERLTQVPGGRFHRQREQGPDAGEGHRQAEEDQGDWGRSR